jgi:hypothetical protein
VLRCPVAIRVTGAHRRMKRLQLIWLVVVLLFVASATRAVAVETLFFYSGNQLWDNCKSNPPDPDCIGYVAGVADAMALNDGWVGGWRACFQARTTRGQITDVVKQWLQSRPEERHYGAPALVVEALAQAFPCPH